MDAYYPYSLVSNRGITRKGTLISSAGGYADLFPWPEFGDLDLDQQLHLLKKGKPTPLAQRSFKLAIKDGEWRKAGINPIRNNDVENHFLINDFSEADIPSGFQTLKIKMMENFRIQIPFLEKWADRNFKIRLDFNSSLTFENFLNFSNALSANLKNQIDFVEDPFPYSLENWKAANEQLPLACDFEQPNVDWNQSVFPFTTVIYKPARQDRSQIQGPLASGLNLVVTSSMDHPMGCLHALVESIELKKEFGSQILDAGCMSWPIYGTNDYTEKIKVSGSKVIDVEGLGIGFDRILQRLPWIPI